MNKEMDYLCQEREQIKRRRNQEMEKEEAGKRRKLELRTSINELGRRLGEERNEDEKRGLAAQLDHLKVEMELYFDGLFRFFVFRFQHSCKSL